MTWKWWIVAAGLIAALTMTGSASRAEEGAPPPAEKPPASPEEPKKEATDTAKTETKPASSKPSFWGDHNALFLSIAGGSGSSDDVESSLETAGGSFPGSAISKVKLDDVTDGRIGIGWKLPADRGGFLVSFTGYRENSYTFHSDGTKYAVSAPGGVGSRSPNPYIWWTVDVDHGNLTAKLWPPVWTDDPTRLEPHCPVGDPGPDQPENPPGHCANGIVDPGEVVVDPTPTAVVHATVPDNAQNRLQVIDGLFRREFGGPVWSGDWSGGLRYLVYDGNVPTAAWLNVTQTIPSQGFTDGAGLRLLSINQSTTGVGPTGSLGVQFHTWKRRLTFYLNGRFAFLLSDLSSDTGTFFTIVRDGTDQLVSPARLEKSVSKSTWNLGGEVGARFRILEGFHVELAWNRTSYQDTVLLPYSMTIPARPTQLQLGVVGLYNTRDLVFDTLHVGLSFQF